MVLTASESRKQARESLRGKWSIVILTFLLFTVYSTLVSFLGMIPFLGIIFSIAGFIFLVPFAYGLLMSMMKLKRGETINCYDFFILGWQNFSRAWRLTGRLLLKMIIPLVLIIVGIFFFIASLTASFIGGVGTGSSDIFAAGSALSLVGTIVAIVGYVFTAIYTFKYALSMYIAVDNPNMLPLDCVNKSAELMNGHKGRLFCLMFSFIGWYLLAAVLTAIPFVGVIVPFVISIVLAPYIQMACLVFYENRAGIDTSATYADGSVATSNEIAEQSGSTDVKAEIVDIPNTEDK